MDGVMIFQLIFLLAVVSIGLGGFIWALTKDEDN